MSLPIPSSTSSPISTSTRHLPTSDSSFGLACLNEGASADNGILKGQAEIWELMYAVADSLAVKCAVELRIPDIINSHGSPMSLSQIASNIIGSSSPCLASLSRVMRLLVRKNIFTAIPSDGCEEILYGLTHSSRWLLQDGCEKTLVPMFMMETHPWMMSPYHQLSAAIKEGGTAFEKAHECTLWELASKNPEFNTLINNGMASTAKVAAEALLSVYKDGFQGVGTLVDVAGGKGDLVAEIVKASSHRIKGINFDLQHVVESAPIYPGVTHVGGDMFESIPCADAIIMKWVLHDWSDDECLKILKNCKEAMSKAKQGKLILVEMVVQPEGRGLFDDTTMRFDLVMMAHCSGGKERTQLEWIELLEKAGFSSCKFIKIPALPSIIEAYAF